jgi:hypothetical protein
MDFLQLSTSANAVTRLCLGAEVLRWWDKNGQNLPDDDVPSAKYTSVLGPPALRYSFQDIEEYDIGSDRRAADPHFQFRNLKYGDHAGAVRFLSRCGLLTEKGPDVITEDDRTFLVSLPSFWARWRRFVAVSQLWETHPQSPQIKGEPGALKLHQAWGYLLEHRDQIESVGGQLFPREEEIQVAAERAGGTITTTTAPWPGDLPNPPKQHLDDPGKPISKPADWGDAPRVVETIPSMNDSQRGELALLLIERELNRFAQPRGGWVHIPAHSRLKHPSFRLTVNAPSLWGLIWQRFAQETCSERPWRICPHCNRAFYPPRNDRFFCNARLSSLYSKRKWARKNRPRSRSIGRSKKQED